MHWSVAKGRVTDPVMDDILKSHLIEPMLLRMDAFEAFFTARKAALLALIGRAMQKVLVDVGEPPQEDEIDAEDTAGGNGEV